ncbi:hypothetical protein AK812_SmicGene43582, partial [Symbiodinium microadriaticum]
MGLKGFLNTGQVDIDFASGASEQGGHRLRFVVAGQLLITLKASLRLEPLFQRLQSTFGAAAALPAQALDFGSVQGDNQLCQLYTAQVVVYFNFNFDTGCDQLYVAQVVVYFNFDTGWDQLYIAQ